MRVCLVLGLLVLEVLLVASWLWTAHRLVSPWPPTGEPRLDQVEGLAGMPSSQR